MDNDRAIGLRPQINHPSQVRAQLSTFQAMVTATLATLGTAWPSLRDPAPARRSFLRANTPAQRPEGGRGRRRCGTPKRSPTGTEDARRPQAPRDTPPELEQHSGLQDFEFTIEEEKPSCSRRATANPDPVRWPARSASPARWFRTKKADPTPEQGGWPASRPIRLGPDPGAHSSDPADSASSESGGRLWPRAWRPGPGAASAGAFHARDAVHMKAKGTKVVLCASETSPETCAG